ncbi:hypothetical protein B7486_01115 [cyanobacterium TDX16]|nr:hypothetical protein B7486_01115 [cyanobacterium TDX16]
MITWFDESKFLSLHGLELGEYMHKVQESSFAGIDVHRARKLLLRAADDDYEQCVYAIWIAVRFKINGVCDAAIEFLKREAVSGGPRITVLRMLRDAADLTASKIGEIEEIQFPREFIPAYDAFVTVLEEEIEILKGRVRLD